MGQPLPIELRLRTLKYFMWGYQSHFAGSAKYLAHTLLKNIDQDFEPNVFLVGLLIENSEGACPVAIEPEDCGYKIDDFSGLQDLTEEYREKDPNSQVRHLFSLAQKSHDANVKLAAIQLAIKSKCDIRRLNDPVLTFVSWPVRVEKHYVCIVLEIQSAIYDKLYRLNNKKDRSQRFPLCVSLLDALIREYFWDCENALRLPDPGSALQLSDREPDEFMRLAGKRLMLTPAYACDEFMGLYGLFNACNIISSLKYEGAGGNGKMLIARRGHPNIEEVITLISSVPLTEYRAARKMLEISISDLMLISDSTHIVALGRQIGHYDYTQEDLFQVNFVGHYKWEFRHNNFPLMMVSYGQPDILRIKLDREVFVNNLSRAIGLMDRNLAERLWHLVMSASEQRHGTIVVISANARQEAERLQSQCIKIKPTILTNETMKMVTSIDGSVLIDHESRCYAIGVILDGLATPHGTPARGARYNSAVRYVEQRPNALAIIVSVDGSVEMIPSYPLPILKSDVVNRIQLLKEILARDVMDLTGFSKTMDWFIKHSFYLTKYFCNQINDLRASIEVMFLTKEPSMFRYAYRDFQPDEAMNESFFLEDAPGPRQADR